MPSEFEHGRPAGVVYTPDKVAKEVVRIGMQAVSSGQLCVLEPSAGDGAFLRAVLEKDVTEEQLTAVDVDKEATKALENLYSGTKVVTADFIEFALRRNAGRFNLIVGNPPFIKRDSYGSTFKESVRRLAKFSDFPASEMKNAWAAFVVGCTKLLRVGGALALVLPYELITVKYGRAVQLFLVQNGFSLEIFVPDKKAFPEIEQDAVILLARRTGTAPGGNTVHVRRVDECSDLTVMRSSAVDLMHERNAAIDWKSILLDSETITLLHKLRKNLSTIVEFCESSPGIVTAANEYFILNDSELKQRGLTRWSRKILKKGSYLPKSPVFGEEDITRISKNEPSNLVDFFVNEQLEMSNAAIQYISECEKNGIHERYKCQRRKPWYRIPIVEPGDGFFFKRSHIVPRLCINDARVLVTDTAYRIRMKDDYSVRGLCFSFYNSLTLLFAEIDGRFYGGGVLELTPEEFRGLPISMFMPTEVEFDNFVGKMCNVSGSDIGTVGYCDSQMRCVLGISEEQMARVRTALKCLRSHRVGRAVE